MHQTKQNKNILIESGNNEMPLGSGSAAQKFCLAEMKGFNKQVN